MNDSLPGNSSPDVDETHSNLNARRRDTGDGAVPFVFISDFETPSAEAHLRHGDLTVYASSVVGASHAQRGGVREDAFLVAAGTLPSSVVAVVADGVGSIEGASRASSVAVASVHHMLASTDLSGLGRGSGDPSRWTDAATAWAWQAEEVVRFATTHVAHSSLRFPDATAATTLTFAVLWPDDGGIHVAWAAVGDSPAFALLADGTFGWVYEPPERNYTDALPRRRHPLVSGVEHLPIGTSILLASDGLGQVFTADLDVASQMRGCLTGTGHGIGRLSELIRLPVPGAHDDRTLVLVADVRAPMEAASP